MTIQEIKDQKQRAIDQLIDECGMFFAFTNEQFEKNKTPIADGDKYTACGGGAYMPKSKVQAWMKGSKAIERNYKAAIKIHKQRKENILFELRNREAFYTCDIQETLEVLGSDYTYDEVMAVFKANKKVYA